MCAQAMGQSTQVENTVNVQMPDAQTRAFILKTMQHQLI